MKNNILFSFILMSICACQSPSNKPEAPKAAETPTAPVAQTTPTFCYQMDQGGEHVKCQLLSAANGEFTGYYTWYIEGKDGTQGVLKGKNFLSDTLIAEHTYMQEGIIYI